MAWVMSGLVRGGLLLALMGLARRFREWVEGGVGRCGRWIGRLF